MSTVLNGGILGLSILWLLNSSGDGGGIIYSILVFDLGCLKIGSFLSVAELQRGYVVGFRQELRV